MVRRKGETYPSDLRRTFRVTKVLAFRTTDKRDLGMMVTALAMMKDREAERTGNRARLSKKDLATITGIKNIGYAATVLGRVLERFEGSLRDLRRSPPDEAGGSWEIYIPKFLNYQGIDPEKTPGQRGVKMPPERPVRFPIFKTEMEAIAHPTIRELISRRESHPSGGLPEEWWITLLSSFREAKTTKSRTLPLRELQEFFSRRAVRTAGWFQFLDTMNLYVQRYGGEKPWNYAAGMLENVIGLDEKKDNHEAKKWPMKEKGNSHGEHERGTRPDEHAEGVPESPQAKAGRQDRSARAGEAPLSHDD